MLCSVGKKAGYKIKINIIIILVLTHMKVDKKSFKNLKISESWHCLLFFILLFSSKSLHCLCISFIIIRIFKDSTSFLYIDCPMIIFTLFPVCLNDNLISPSGFQLLEYRYNASYFMCMVAFMLGSQCPSVSSGHICCPVCIL